MKKPKIWVTRGDESVYICFWSGERPGIVNDFRGKNWIGGEGCRGFLCMCRDEFEESTGIRLRKWQCLEITVKEKK